METIVSDQLLIIPNTRENIFRDSNYIKVCNICMKYLNKVLTQSVANITLKRH